MKFLGKYQNRVFILLIAINLVFNCKAIDTVSVTVDWGQVQGELTNMHWGVNDFKAKNYTSPDNQYREYLNRVNPGIVRLHQHGLISSWVNIDKEEWDTAQIDLTLGYATAGYPNAKIILCFSDWPEFIAPDNKAVPLEKEKAMEDFFAQIPGIMKHLGYKIHYYEFLNENDEAYTNDPNLSIEDYARLIARLGSRIKTEASALNLDYQVKVGGSAIRWPNSAWYEPIIQIAGPSMDFFSWHHYAMAPAESGVTEEERNQDLMSSIGWLANSAVSTIINYAKTQGMDHLEFFMDEFNIQYVWTPYEKRTHNNVGAVWFATVIRDMAKNGIDATMMWNAKDGAYGLLPDDSGISAPGQLYLWGNRYLNGKIHKITSSQPKIDAIAIKKADGDKNILLVNKSNISYHVNNLTNMLGLADGTKLYGLKMDATTQTSRHNNPTDANIHNNGVDLPAYGLVLITATTPEALLPVTNLTVELALHDALEIEFSDPNEHVYGYNIYVNSQLAATTRDTNYYINNLRANNNYNVQVAVLDEFYLESETKAVNYITRNMPLKINDQTIGNSINRLNYNSNWVRQANAMAYNSDVMNSTTTGAKVNVTTTGNFFTLFGYVQANTIVSITIDENPATQIYFDEAADGLLWNSGNIEQGEHEISIEFVEGDFLMIDFLGVYGNQFSVDNEAPQPVSGPTVRSSFKSINIKWEEPYDNTGVQGYFIKINDEPFDTVYSPYIAYNNLPANTNFNFEVKAFDVAGNASDKISFSGKTQDIVYTKVGFTETAPTIDGEIEEAWKSKNKMPINEILEGTTTVEASYRVMWDKNYLYLLVAVDKFQGDINDINIHTFIDSYNDKPGAYGDNDFWYTFNGNGTYSEAYFNNTSNNKISTTSTGFNFEASFKWSRLRVASVDSTYSFGFEVHVSSQSETSPFTLSWLEGTQNAGINNSLLANMQLSTDTLTVGKYEKSNRPVALYPNPVQNKLVVVAAQAKNFEIYDIKGRQIALHPLQMSDEKWEFNTSTLKQGIYFVRIAENASYQVLRFIKL